MPSKGVSMLDKGAVDILWAIFVLYYELKHKQITDNWETALNQY